MHFVAGVLQFNKQGRKPLQNGGYKMNKAITSVLTKDLKLKHKIGKIIATTLDNHDGTTDEDSHGYYIDNQNRLWISYPSSYYAIDRQVTQDDIIRALDGLSGDSSVEEINRAIVDYFAI